MNWRLRRSRLVCMFLIAAGVAVPALAGGPWITPKGEPEVRLGWSRKTATVSWNAFGETLDHNGHAHDFRYFYLDGEFALSDRFSATYLVTWLDGREGRPGHVEKNSGFSDAWFGLKYALRKGSTPMALAVSVRSDIFYDLDGPYERHLYDEDGNFISENPEWRGLNRMDAALLYHIGRSLRGGDGWTSAMVGYNWREGAPADEIRFAAEIGWKLPWHGISVKGSTYWSFSMKNNSVPEEGDRFNFRGRTDYNFNFASMGRVGLSVLAPFGESDRYVFEVGYNRWIWGESARQYGEPFASIGYRF